MDIKVIVGVGATRWEVSIQERDERLALVKATFFSQPAVCGKCRATEVRWDTRKVKGPGNQTFTYVSRICQPCGAQSDAGEYADGGYFWKPWAARPARVRLDAQDLPVTDRVVGRGLPAKTVTLEAQVLGGRERVS